MVDLDRKKSQGYETDDYYASRRSFAAGGILGMALSMLVVFALSNWLTEDQSITIVIICTLVPAVVGGIFWPVERLDRNPDHYSGAITPAERVDRIHARRQDGDGD